MAQSVERPGFHSRQELGLFPFATASRPVLGAHPASYQMGTGGKAAGG